MLYSLRATLCPATCADPDAPLDCTYAPGCTCPDGKILHEGLCVDPGQCGCETEEENRVQVCHCSVFHILVIFNVYGKEHIYHTYMYSLLIPVTKGFLCIQKVFSHAYSLILKLYGKFQLPQLKMS
jgi:hypothetical protein